MQQLLAAGLDPADPRVKALVSTTMMRGEEPALGLLPEEETLPGRDDPTSDIAGLDATHFIKGTPLHGPFPEHLETIILGVCCIAQAQVVAAQV